MTKHLKVSHFADSAVSSVAKRTPTEIRKCKCEHDQFDHDETTRNGGECMILGCECDVFDEEGRA